MKYILRATYVLKNGKELTSIEIADSKEKAYKEGHKRLKQFKSAFKYVENARLLLKVSDFAAFYYNVKEAVE